MIALIMLSKFDAARFTLLYEVNAASYVVFLVMSSAALSGRSPERRQPKLAENKDGKERFRWRDQTFHHRGEAAISP